MQCFAAIGFCYIVQRSLKMNSLLVRLFLMSMTFVAVGCGGTKELPPSTEAVNRLPEDAMQNAMKESMERGGRKSGEIPKEAPGK